MYTNLLIHDWYASSLDIDASLLGGWSELGYGNNENKWDHTRSVGANWLVYGNYMVADGDSIFKASACVLIIVSI